MKKVIIYISIFFISVSCLYKKDNVNSDSELNILNDIFLELVGTEYYYERLPISPMPLEYAENKQDSINYQIQKEKYDKAFANPKLDKSELVLGISSDFKNPKREFRDWNTQESSFPREYYPAPLHSKDFDQLLAELVDSTSFQRGKLELIKLKQTGKYIIKDLGQLENQNKEYWKSKEYRYIASIRFSDFKINKNNDKAIFYFDFLCGNLCGSGEIIFCIKENEKWKIVERNILWVS